MSYTIKEVLSGINEPVSIDDAKEHLRVTGTDEDDYILALTTVARKHVENETGLTLHGATYDYFIDEFPDDDIELPFPPLLAVTYVKYYNGSNVLTTLVEDTDYIVDANGNPGRIEAITSWPYTYDRRSAVQVRFTAGYSDYAEINPLAIHAMKLKLSILYENREGDDKLEEGLTRVINKIRSVRF